ncbi:UNVERIFIED_CONTAM: hypothetical protein GTU68_027153, partial [Idotea baltica]|nr:hypothetical protein [Idotea baltica]
EVSIIYAIDLIGTLVFAISGVLTGISKKFDIFGAAVLGFVTAVGGGTLRDILTGSLPVSWIKDTNYVILIILAVPIVYLFRKQILKLRKTMFLFDSIGIGLFTVLGVQKTLDLGLSPIICILMGAIGAVFGGVLRDTLSNEIPLIFRKEIYATACLLGGSIFYFLLQLSVPIYIAQSISIFIVILIRILAVKNHWSLNFSK